MTNYLSAVGRNEFHVVKRSMLYTGRFCGGEVAFKKQSALQLHAPSRVIVSTPPCLPASLSPSKAIIPPSPALSPRTHLFTYHTLPAVLAATTATRVCGKTTPIACCSMQGAALIQYLPAAKPR